MTHNEELNIRRTLQSFRGVFGEVVVVDSGSTDSTVRIAEEEGARVLTHPYRDHASQWNWVFSEAHLLFDWVFLVDADFQLSDSGAKAIQDRFAAGVDRVDGFFIRHRYVFRGAPIRFGGTKTWWMRIVRRGKFTIDASELVDFRVSVIGRVEKLDALVLEDNLKEYDLDFWIDKHQNFSNRLSAEEVLRERGFLRWENSLHSPLQPEGRRVHMKQLWASLPTTLRAPFYFLFRYVLLLGFLDGKAGFQFHFLQAFWFRVVVDMKVERLRRQLNLNELTLAAIADRVKIGKTDSPVLAPRK